MGSLQITSITRRSWDLDKGAENSVFYSRLGIACSSQTAPEAYMQGYTVSYTQWRGVRQKEMSNNRELKPPFWSKKKSVFIYSMSIGGLFPGKALRVQSGPEGGRGSKGGSSSPLRLILLSTYVQHQGSPTWDDQTGPGGCRMSFLYLLLIPCAQVIEQRARGLLAWD